MAAFRYRAATVRGTIETGVMDGASREEALEKLRRLGLAPIETVAADDGAAPRSGRRIGGSGRQALARAISDLAVLLDAGLTLDRALAIVTESIAVPVVQAAFAELLRQVREGVPLSQAMALSGGLFSPMACAMTAAGEAHGRSGQALARLAQALERAEALRQTILSSLIYPAFVLVLAGAVILLMLVGIVPQFESLFADAGERLPAMTRMVLRASHDLRSHGLLILSGLAVTVFIIVLLLRREATRQRIDRWLLDLPLIGLLVRKAETARLSRVLGALVEGGVALPTALDIARGAVVNRFMRERLAAVSVALRQGGGLAAPFAATGLFPPLVQGFLRTGEETAQLGMMLERLADVLDEEVRTGLARAIGLLAPTLTLALGAVVAGVIAAIMSAIIGFNDLALAP